MEGVLGGQMNVMNFTYIVCFAHSRPTTPVLPQALHLAVEHYAQRETAGAEP